MPDCLARILRFLGVWSPAADQTTGELQGSVRQEDPVLPQRIRRSIRWLLLYEVNAVQLTDELFMEAPRKSPLPDARARQLLLRVLDPAQRDEFLQYGYFTVHVPDWGCFRISPRTTFNVLNVQTGIAYCAGPDITVPLPDLMLAQKLILENEPRRFFRVANHRPEKEGCFGVSL